MLFVNAIVHTMCSGIIDGGFVQVLDGKIAALGCMAELADSMSDQRVVDLGGKLLMPGFVDAHCHLGLIGDGVGVEGDDCNEDSEAVTPHLRALDGVNPFDRAFAEARAAGITCAVVSPGSANPIAGQVLALKTAGRRADDMILRAPLAIKFALGENPKKVHGANKRSPRTRMGEAAIIRKELFRAAQYLEQSRAASEKGTQPPPFDLACEALTPLLTGDIGAHIHAHKAQDILTGVRIAQEFSLRCTIIHCTEGHLIADILAGLDVRAVCGPLPISRSKPELAGAEISLCASLEQAGVLFAISSDHPELPIQFLPFSARIAMTGGLSHRLALESITSAAAKAVGINDRVGSIAPGLDADLLVFSGDPLSPGNCPEQIFINGEPV